MRFHRHRPVDLPCHWPALMTLAPTFVIMMVAACSARAASIFAPDSTLYNDARHNAIERTLPSLTGTDRDNALRIAKIPKAAWFTGGTPEQVQRDVATLVASASAKHQVPVLVAYNLPSRDCQQYSAGGAHSTKEYRAWIDAFAAGIGTHTAAVILEPDSLGIVPHYVDLSGRKEWCQPKELDASTAADEHFAQLQYASEKLADLPHVAVYLDGTHSAWLRVGDSARRLARAGVARAQGFFLNVSNYQPTEDLLHYGTWVAKCLAYGRFKECATTRGREQWRNVDAWYDEHVKANAALKHFVIDTSRNGRGAWTVPPDKYRDAEAWCNPPGRGLGDVSNTNTAQPLLDAKLWIKIPGESDGACLRGTPGPQDPERGIVAPPAGQWFKEQAAELMRFADPPLDR